MKETIVTSLMETLDVYYVEQPREHQILYDIIKSLFEAVNKKISTSLIAAPAINYVESKKSSIKPGHTKNKMP